MKIQLTSNCSSVSARWTKILLNLAFAPSLLIPLMPLSATAKVPNNRCISSYRQVDSARRLQVFARPSRDAQTIARLTNGTKVLVHLSDRSGNFNEIEVSEGFKGWVLASGLAPLSSEVRQFNGFLQVQTIDGGRVNMRQNPSRSANIITKLVSGNVVRYGHDEGEWIYATDSIGHSGYIANKYLLCTTARFNLLNGPDRN